MRKPIPLLDDDKPLDVIAAGEYRRVSKVLAGLESSGAVVSVDVDSRHVSGVWWRHVPAGGTCTSSRLIRRTTAGSVGGRRGAVFADSEATAWAEWYRYLAEAGVAPERGLPRDVWRWEISLSEVADLSDEGRLARVGLPALLPSRLQPGSTGGRVVEGVLRGWGELAWSGGRVGVSRASWRVAAVVGLVVVVFVGSSDRRWLWRGLGRAAGRARACQAAGSARIRWSAG